MDNATSQLNRRTLLIGAGASGLLAALPASAHAQNLGGLGLSSILGKATDSALDKLAKPGAFTTTKIFASACPFLVQPLAADQAAACSAMSLAPCAILE